MTIVDDIAHAVARDVESRIRNAFADTERQLARRSERIEQKWDALRERLDKSAATCLKDADSIKDEYQRGRAVGTAEGLKIAAGILRSL